MANKPTPADFSPTVPDFPVIGQYQPIYGKFDLTTYIQGASDYEIMAFLVQCYNATLKGYSDVTQLSKDTVTAYNQLQVWVNTWFNELDVQQEINNKLQAMFEAGTLATAIAQSGTIPAAVAQYLNSAEGTKNLSNVTAKKIEDMAVTGELGRVIDNTGAVQSTTTSWLTQNVTPAGSAVMVDKSLSIEGAAADAKETGEAISSLKSELTNLCVCTKALPTDKFYAENPYTVYVNQEAYHTNINMAIPNAMDLTNDVVIFGITIHRNADGTLRLTGTPVDGVCTFRYSKAHFRAGKYYTAVPSNVTVSLRSGTYSVDFNSSFTATEDTDELWYTVNSDSAVDMTIQPMLYDREVQFSKDYIECKWESVSNNFIAYNGINHVLAKDDIVLTFESLNNKCRPEFWGAIGNGKDDSTPLNKMMEYCSANKESIEFPKKTYGINYPITILGVMDVNFNYAVIMALQDVSALFNINCKTNDQFQGVFRNCILDGELKAESCIVVTKNINAMSFENLQVYDPKKYGIWCMKGGGGEFYNIILRSRHDDGVARTALQIEAPDTKWKAIKAVNFCTFAYVKGITHMEQIHPFITYASYNTKSIAIYVDGTSVFITNSYIDTYFRCFFNPDQGGGYGNVFATNVMFFWSLTYFTGSIRPSICYNGIQCRLVNCRIHRPDGTTTKTLLYGEQGQNDKTYLNINILNKVEGLARQPAHDSTYDNM